MCVSVCCYRHKSGANRWLVARTTAARASSIFMWLIKIQQLLHGLGRVPGISRPSSVVRRLVAPDNGKGRIYVLVVP